VKSEEVSGPFFGNIFDEATRGTGTAEEGFPVVDTGTDFVPDILSENT
jgi:hypothetical protein